MGQRISIERCYANFGVQPNCSFNATWSGEYQKGQVPTEPDIAGVGVVFSFIAVTGFAALLSLCKLSWDGFVAIEYRQSKVSSEDDRRDLMARKFDFAGICDKLMMACSDQQIVVGSAYLWGVHNGTGCTMSFYHLIIVSNMIVLSCATHLISLVSTIRYYRNPYIAMIRIILIFVIIGYAGKLMSSAYTDGATKLPSALPQTDEEEAVLFLTSPCFMKRSISWRLRSGWPAEDNLPLWQDDDTSSRFLGWQMYVMIVSYTGLAVFVTWMRELFRPPPLDQTRKPRGLRGIVHGRHNVREFMAKHHRAFVIADWIYRFLGVGAATGAIINSCKAIVRVRSWAQRSGWLEAGERSKLAESDINDLGQLLAAFTCALIFFVLIEESFTELKSWRKRRRDSDLSQIASTKGANVELVQIPARSGGTENSSSEGQARRVSPRLDRNTATDTQLPWGGH